MERLRTGSERAYDVDARVLAGSAVGTAQHDLDRFVRDPAHVGLAERHAVQTASETAPTPHGSPSPGWSSSARLCPAHSSTTGRVRCSNVRSVTAGRPSARTSRLRARRPMCPVDRRGWKVVSTEVRRGLGPALLERRERGGKVHRRLVSAY